MLPRERLSRREFCVGSPGEGHSWGSLTWMNLPQGHLPQGLAWIQATQLLRGLGPGKEHSVGPQQGLATT